MLAVLAFGILLMARGVFSSGESHRLLPFALGSALGTAGYSIADGLGARASGDASGYVGWLFLCDALLFTIWGVQRRGLRALAWSGRVWGLGLFAGAGSVGAVRRADRNGFVEGTRGRAQAVRGPLYRRRGDFDAHLEVFCLIRINDPRNIERSNRPYMERRHE